MKIYCIGIGGIGLSGVAEILKSQGHEVMGSDSALSAITESLVTDGIEVLCPQQASNLPEGTDLVIYSEAIPENNPERMRANELGIKSINYAHALGMVTDGKRLIAITGTHGKTTITGMLAGILMQTAQDPSIIIGSRIDVLGGRNYRAGGGELFLAEACEYRDNFLTLTPTIMLINNLEPDHLDYFKNAEKYYESYRRLAERIPEDGNLIMLEADTKKFDLSGVKAKVIILKPSGKAYNLQIPGKQNQQNAFAAEAVAKALGINPAAIHFGLSGFNGTWRRFEYKGMINGAKVYDDYGHHPTEIRATIQAAREWYPDQKLIVVFQPHQYSRTREFFDEFVTCFKGADEVWMTDIYKARDTAEDIASTSAEKLTLAIREHQSARHLSMDEVPEELQKTVDADTIVLVMGAGNINQIFQRIAFDAKR